MQDKDQMKNDPRDLRVATRAGDWVMMRVMLRRMPIAQINSGAKKDEGDPEEIGVENLFTCAP